MSYVTAAGQRPAIIAHQALPSGSPPRQHLPAVLGPACGDAFRRLQPTRYIAPHGLQMPRSRRCVTTPVGGGYLANSLQAAIKALTGVRPVSGPLEPMLHLAALNEHVDEYIHTYAEPMRELQHCAVRAFASGASHVSIDTRELFPARLCDAAWRDVQARRKEEERRHKIRLPAWEQWLRGVFGELHQTLQLPASCGDTRFELRAEGKGLTPWHVDGGAFAATTALKGPSTEFAPAVPDTILSSVRWKCTPMPHEYIETIPTGHTLIFAGVDLPKPLYHRSPPGEGNRLVFVA